MKGLMEYARKRIAEEDKKFDRDLKKEAKAAGDFIRRFKRKKKKK